MIAPPAPGILYDLTMLSVGDVAMLSREKRPYSQHDNAIGYARHTVDWVRTPHPLRKRPLNCWLCPTVLVTEPDFVCCYFVRAEPRTEIGQQGFVICAGCAARTALDAGHRVLDALRAFVPGAELRSIFYVPMPGAELTQQSK